MLEFNGKGLIAPVFTPFKENGDLNLEMIDEYYKLLDSEKALDGILINGTTGEGMSMTASERKLCVEKWMEVLKKNGSKMHVMVQVGGAPLPYVLEMAKHAEQIGANSILCLPDLYMKPKTPQELIDYLKLVAAAAPNTPLLYYHIPMFTNVTIHMGRFLEQVKDSLPTFVGIKFTSNDLDEGYEALEVDNRRFAVFLGADTLMLSACVLNFDSFIATTLNFLGVTAKTIVNKSLPPESRLTCQLTLNQVVKVITKYGGWVPTMKDAMNKHKHDPSFTCGPVRAPMQSLEPVQIESLAKELTELFEKVKIL